MVLKQKISLNCIYLVLLLILQSPQNLLCFSEILFFKGITYQNLEGYLYLEQKKLGLVKKNIKQIDTFELSGVDLDVNRNNCK